MHLSGAVAQLVERPTQNRKGLGSIPGGSSSFKSESSAHGLVKCLVLASNPENLSALN